MLIPPLALIAWSMLQPATVFDGVAPNFDTDWRWTLGLAGAALLGIAAGLLGVKADKQTPAKTPPAA